MRESLRRRYEVGATLDEQLAEAVRSENYELAARLRDQIRAGLRGRRAGRSAALNAEPSAPERAGSEDAPGTAG
jgi:excinuclease UvrABC nuclease subunit